jgi:hypothetical protein
MRIANHKVAILAVLLVLVILGAQLHCCTDLTSESSHLCPVCSTAHSVAPVAPIRCAGLVLSHRVEVLTTPKFVSVLLPLVLSPRAPPAH